MSFNCELCQKIFSSKFNLDRHKANKSCSIKLNTNNTLGPNMPLELIITKLSNTIREEVFKLEKTNTYANKSDMVDMLCEAMALNIDEYLSNKEKAVENQNKLQNYEVKKKNILENGKAQYIENQRKIKELEKEIIIDSSNLKKYEMIEKFKTLSINIKSDRELDQSIINKYTGWDDDDICDFMNDIQDLTMENLDKFHSISNGKTIDWLNDEFYDKKQLDKETLELYYLAKYYITFKFKEQYDLTKNVAYFKKRLERNKTILDGTKCDNESLNNEYFCYTEKLKPGCGEHLIEICDPLLQEKIKLEEERNKRLIEYKQSIANTIPSAIDSNYSDSDND